MPVAITLRHDDDGVIWSASTLPGLSGDHGQLDQAHRRATVFGLRECVGFGFGRLRLAVFEANRALHFLSLRYFWQPLGRLRWLPDLLSPGVAHVIHEDLGDGCFRFAMTIHHPWFGTPFQQDGVFHRAGELQ